MRDTVIRVVVAEDNYLVREGIRQVLELAPGVELGGVAEDRPTLERAIEDHQPDVVITDIRMPPTGTDEGLQVARRLRDEHPRTGVVVLSHYVEPEYALALLEKGASGRGYLLKERVSDVEQLVEAIKEVARGGSVIDPAVVEALVQAQKRQHASPLAELTQRELQVLELVAQGRNNAGIAGQLFLSERAVEKHINAIFSKLGVSEEADVHRRVKAVLLYLAERRN